MTGLIDSTLEELDSNLRDLRRQLATLEAFRRQIIGDDEAQIRGAGTSRKDSRGAK